MTFAATAVAEYLAEQPADRYKALMAVRSLSSLAELSRDAIGQILKDAPAKQRKA